MTNEALHTNDTTTRNYTPAPAHPSRPQLKGNGDAATDQRTGVAQLNEWARLDELEGHVPADLNAAAYGLVHLAQRCAAHGVQVRLDTRPGLRLAIDAAKVALATIEEELLLRYARDRQEVDEQGT